MASSMKRLSCLLIIALATIFNSAQAEVYLRGSALYNFTGQSEVFNLDRGYGVSLAGGYDFAVFRLEGELLIARGGISELEGEDNPLTSADGSFNEMDFNLNGIFEIEGVPIVTPYIGFGIGAARFDVDDVEWFRVRPGTTDTIEFVGSAPNSKHVVFGYQLLLGVYYDIPQTSWQLQAGYRFRSSNEAEIDLANSAGEIVDSFTFRDNHTIELGAVFRF